MPRRTEMTADVRICVDKAGFHVKGDIDCVTP